MAGVFCCNPAAMTAPYNLSFAAAWAEKLGSALHISNALLARCADNVFFHQPENLMVVYKAYYFILESGIHSQNPEISEQTYQ